MLICEAQAGKAISPILGHTILQNPDHIPINMNILMAPLDIAGMTRIHNGSTGASKISSPVGWICNCSQQF